MSMLPHSSSFLDMLDVNDVSSDIHSNIDGSDHHEILFEELWTLISDETIQKLIISFKQNQFDFTKQCQEFCKQNEIDYYTLVNKNVIDATFKDVICSRGYPKTIFL